MGIAESASERYRLTVFVNSLFDEFHSAATTDEYGKLYTDTFVTRIPTVQSNVMRVSG